MKKLLAILLFILLFDSSGWGQAQTRRLPSIINHPSLNLFAPYVSFDGDALLFVSDDGDDHALTVSYTSRENDWMTPTVLPKHINHRLIYLKGFALNANGKRLYFTSAKSPTVGGYDIMWSDLNGNTWSEPQNLLLPINSKSDEGCPSVSSDEKMIFFMRCERMNQREAGECSLFMASKMANGQWGEPVALPSKINTGNSQTPRIMADGETLIFSSDKMGGGRGGMDLYLTRLRGGSWSDPQPLDFVNSEKDEQFVSVAALGRYLLKEAPGKRTSELTEFLIPKDLRPFGMMKLEGKITDPDGKPIPAYISVTDLATAQRFYTGRPSADGSYMVYLKEGTTYEMSVDPEQSNVTFFTKKFDLTTDRIPQRERANVTLKPLELGDELTLEYTSFVPNSSTLERTSEEELKRLARVLKANPQYNVEMQVMLTGYEEDSVQSSPDLTEMVIDTVVVQVEDIDTLGQLFTRDSLIVDTVYHNDRTHQQAERIIEYLVAQGADEQSFSHFGNAIPAILPEDRKLTIKAVLKAKTQPQGAAR